MMQPRCVIQMIVHCFEVGQGLFGRVPFLHSAFLCSSRGSNSSTSSSTLWHKQQHSLSLQCDRVEHHASMITKIHSVNSLYTLANTPTTYR
eukprot:13277-Heterococcus_DN1.PRE.3